MQPELNHFQEFKDILENYQIADRAKKVLKDLKIVLLLAPTSAGKNTLIRYQVNTGRYYNLVSDTTRPPRLNDGVMEQNGVEYWFRTEEEMLADLKAGEYLEAEIIHKQQVSGVSIRELEKALHSGKIAITDIDPRGVHNFTKVKPDVSVVMLLPPSFDEWQRRFALRGDMTEIERNRRLKTAWDILQEGLNSSSYHFVISEDVAESGTCVDAIVKSKKSPHQDRGRELIKSLMASLDKELAKSKNTD